MWKKILKIFTTNIQNVKFVIVKEGLKRYYQNKDKLSNQRKIYYEKNREKLLQKQNNRYTNFKELHRSYVDLQNKLKALEENMSLNDSGNN